MGNAIARNGDTLTQSVANSHIHRERWVSGDEFTSGYWTSASSISATINGTITRSSGSVYANGILVCTKDDRTKETDTHNTISSPYRYDGGRHTNNTNGSISGGSSTVFIGGKSVARKSDSVTNHAGGSTTIAGGSNNVFVG